jgi:flagellar hook-associated protein 1 FlgK
MGIPSILNTGYSGMIASKAGMATSGHNIANSNTEGYSRQRVVTEAADPNGGKIGRNLIGTGTKVARVERVHDEYIEKQIRNSQKDLDHFEEKELALKQVEDIFNEMNGDGLNRLISRFFNEFRKLSQEPESPAVRQSVREATQAVVNDFHRVRKEIDGVRNHLDSRIEGYIGQVNKLAHQISDLNHKVRAVEVSGGSPNDLLDQRDVALRKLTSLVDINTYKDKQGNYNIDIKGVGPLLSGVSIEALSVERTDADEEGKPEGAFDIRAAGNVSGTITHSIKGGRLGALLEARDRTVSSILDRLDRLAFTLVNEVNDIHVQGYNQNGLGNINYFASLDSMDRAAEFISLSDEVQANVSNIATAFEPEAPGDNRIALAIAQLQGEKLLNNGYATFDEWYNSIVSDIGVAASHNRFSMTQQKDIMTQLNKVRDQVSGVSIDEETTSLLQFQHAFDASAKVIQAADEMLKTVLALKKD